MLMIFDPSFNCDGMLRIFDLSFNCESMLGIFDLSFNCDGMLTIFDLRFNCDGMFFQIVDLSFKCDCEPNSRKSSNHLYPSWSTTAIQTNKRNIHLYPYKA